MQHTLDVSVASGATLWISGCVSEKKKLSTDALIWRIVELHGGPISFKDIKKRVKKNRTTIWRNIVLLERKEIIRETDTGSKIYVPFEWSDPKVAVKEALGHLKKRWSQVTTYRVASEAGISLKKVKEIVFPLAKEVGLCIGTVDKPAETECDFSE